MKNKVIFISGGTRGLGLAAAKGFLALGAKVVLNYRSDHKQAEKAKAILDAGERVLLLPGDVSDISIHKDLLTQIITTFGQFDVFVNNAGIASRQYFLETNEDQYDAVMSINVKGAFFLAQAVAKYWVEQEQPGVIINVASIAGHKSTEGLTPYCMSKSAVLLMTKCMANELAPYHIRVNSVSPGVIATDINRAHWEANTPVWQKFMEGIPLGRAGVPENIGEAIVFLAQNEFAVGTDLIIDGGTVA